MTLLRLPRVTPALEAAEPDGILGSVDMAEVFCLSSSNVVQALYAAGGLPRPDGFIRCRRGHVAFWRYATVAEEMMRRINARRGCRTVTEPPAGEAEAPADAAPACQIDAGGPEAGSVVSPHTEPEREP